jgi:Flp pilus assembly protein TadG
MKSLLTRIPAQWRSRRGNAVLEFALGSTFLIAVFTGTFQFGYSFYQYNRLELAVSNGARYAALRPYDSTTTTPSTTFRDAVRNVVVYGSPAGGTSPVVPGLTTTNVVVTPAFKNNVPASMTVAISGFTLEGVVGRYTLNGKPVVTYPYQGIWTPYF